MLRKSIMPRPQWQRRCEEVGFQFHSAGGLYWDESVAYRFTLAEVEQLEAVVADLHQRCLETVNWIVANDYFAPFHLPAIAIDEIRASWQRQDLSIHGRFDFSWTGFDTPKLLEYNADTPTGLLEASMLQGVWLQDVLPHAHQFNSLHEKLMDAWRAGFTWDQGSTCLHFCAIDGHEEDMANALYMMDIAQQAGLPVRFLPLETIAYDSEKNRFIDNASHEIAYCYKLYPWEWVWQSDLAHHISDSKIRFIEPAWKQLLSSKAILPILWQRYPDHPNLLPASFCPNLCGPCMRKPLSRYCSTDICIYQAFAPLPRFDDSYAVLSGWVVNDKPAGLGIREDATLITRSSSRFVPHYVD